MVANAIHQNHSDAARAKELEEQLSAARAQIAKLEADRAKLRAAYDRLVEELQLLKRRIFVAKAERVDSRQLELEFKEVLAKVDALAGTLDLPAPEPSERDSQQEGAGDKNPDKKGGKPRPKPKGRRKLEELPLEEVRVELADSLFEELVAQGKAECIGFEESHKLAWQRAGMRRLVLARMKYRAIDEAGKVAIETTPMPPQLLPRSLAAPSLLGHVLVSKFNDGLPLWRIEEILARDGVPLDRGTMCRWVDEIGGALGATVVEAMRKDALANAFCIASDATGIAVQPDREPGRPRQACHRGHYFVLIADRDHVWFEYTRRETSDAVKSMLGTFSGYVQVDAKSVFDVLFRESDAKGDEGESPPGRRFEVGCWAHARRKFWEAAAARSAPAREALARISRIFELDGSWKSKPPAEIKRLRQAHLRVHVDELLEWAGSEYDKVRDTRGSLRSALGYVVRQKDALRRFLEDGRLRMDNNPSELQLRGRVAVGRKAWLFVGSDNHAETTAGIMSVIASARLHRLDPEAYLRDIIRVLPHWPRERYLELAPKHWAATRERLCSDQLAAEFGPLAIPDPPKADPPEEPPTN